MNHVAIDLGSKESQVCVRRGDGTILDEKKHQTRKLGELLKQLEPSRVILETTSEAFRVADAARAAGHEVRVVPATLARQLGVGEHGVKTDKRDARKLSEVSCRIDLPSVHIPTETARELRSLLRSRELLVATRTKTINHVRGWLRTQLGRLRTGWTGSFTDRVRARASELQQAVPDHIEQVLAAIEAIHAQVEGATRAVKRLASDSAVCRRLMTIPGVGPITALTFVAALDDVHRFEHAYRVHSYLGLAPGERSSSDRERRTSITKAGSTAVRRTLIQAAWVAWRLNPEDPMVRWARQIADRRGRQIAVVALARKLAGVMYALWRDDSTYRATRAARVFPDARAT